MKKLFVILLSSVLSIYVHAQQADIRISELVNKNKWFELYEEYPKLKDSIQYEYVRDLADGLLAHYFESHESGAIKIADAIRKHQAKYGIQATMGLIQLVLTDYEISGNYAIAAQKAKDVIESIEKNNMPLESTLYEDVLKRNTILEKYQKPYIERVNRDVKIPFVTRNPDLTLFDYNKPIDGLIYMPVEYHGKTYNFILDTGASITYLSSRFAKKIGIDKIEDYEYSGNYGNIGYVDSIKIGDGIVFKNIMAFIAKEGVHDKMFTADAVLGMDFIRRIGELQIDIKNKQIIFPYYFTAMPEYGKNIRNENYGIMMKVNDKSGLLTIGLDTGCPMNNMQYPFYQKNMNEFIKNGEKTVVCCGGYLKNKMETVVVIPEYKFEICGKEITLQNLTIPFNPNSGYQDGRDGDFGMGFINLFDKVIINTKDMFIKVE